jgi:tRNA dimethylallyltransferase
MSSSAAWVVEQALRVARETDSLIAIVGPTASGKTALAVALAERLGGEVVSADSVQIYRAFDVGSGKPTAEELARARHHLISEIDALDTIDAASWAQRASRSIATIQARGRVPIVCGGTFLWIKALLFGLADAPGANPSLRAHHRAIAQQEGRTALHERLRAVDAETAARLHPNDFTRVSRALEVYELSGKAMSYWQKQHAFACVRHRARLVAVAHDAIDLTERIRARVSAWLSNGWVDEVESLLAQGYGSARAMGSVGYAQVRSMLDGHLPHEELAGAVVRATRIFARRQRTWLRHAEVTWLS